MTDDIRAAAIEAACIAFTAHDMPSFARFLPDEQDELRANMARAIEAYEEATDQPPYEGVSIAGQEWEHIRTGGVYRLLATGLRESDLSPAVVYQAKSDGVIWVRPTREFFDGRFRPLPGPPEDET